MKKQFLKYHGGKGRILSKILPLFPDHKIYIEPFVGAGTLLINKTPTLEIASDINVELINLWRSLQRGDLIKEVEKIEYTEANFLLAKAKQFSPALNEYILYRMSRGGLQKTFSWSDRLRGGQPGEINAWNNAKQILPIIQERIKNTKFIACNGLTLLEKFNSQNTLVFLDPPYVHSSRSSKVEYGEYEMSDQDHKSIISYFSSTSCKVLLCGYRSELYNILGEPAYIFNVPNNSGQNKNKQRRSECIWKNF